MTSILDYLLNQYNEYSTLNILLEFIAVILGLASVWLSKQNNVLVYPTGMISTLIFVYLLFHQQLIGDMIINAYYFLMSIYGWYYWIKRKDGVIVNRIQKSTNEEYKISLVLFISSVIFVYLIYNFFVMWNNKIAYIDTLTTGIFFVAMWLMARRKLEHWFLWIIGDLISIPLYFYKGLILTSFQYIIFTTIAIAGYFAWKKEIKYQKGNV